MPSTKELERIATQIRRDVVRMVHGVQSGHPGGPLGCADFFAAMYFEILEHNAKKFAMDGKGQDLFFLSNGHLSAGWYSVLARTGYFDTKELSTFRHINSRLQGHPATEEGLPGIRVASGSLGMGLSVSIGAALTKKLNKDNKTVFCLLGDGELQEGQVWEAMMFAAHHKVDNLIATVDYNLKQIDGPVDKVMNLGDLEAKWTSFGWKVLVMNGNNMAEVLETLQKAKECTGKKQPVVILMKTSMGYGVDFMSGTHEWHGKPPSDEQKDIALAQLEETIGDY